MPANAPKEFVVVPKTKNLSASRKLAIYSTMNRVKPANTVVTVDENGLAVHKVIVLRHVASPSEYFEVRKWVTGVNVPEAPPENVRYFWIKNGVEVEAPSFAFLGSQECKIWLNKAVTETSAFILSQADKVYTVLPSAIGVTEIQWAPGVL